MTVVEGFGGPSIGGSAITPSLAREKELAIAIARCSNVDRAMGDDSHACHEVVNFQRDTPDRHIPEAWFGNLSGAKVLLISSNPSIDLSENETVENYPRGRWSDDEIAEWITRRTDQSWSDVPVTFKKSDKKDFLWRCIDGEYRGAGPSNSPQTTWNKTHRRVMELLGEEADPSRNYALTEVVHCKSTGEQGVASAAPVCSQTWLTRIMSIAENASVIILCGSKVLDFWARSGLRLDKNYGRGKKGGVDPEVRSSRDVFVSEISGKHRVFLFMGQPAYSSSLTNLYGPQVVAALGKIARGEVLVPNDTRQLQTFLRESKT